MQSPGDAPTWIRHLDDTDLHFIKRMVLASGSLKQLALLSLLRPLAAKGCDSLGRHRDGTVSA